MIKLNLINNSFVTLSRKRVKVITALLFLTVGSMGISSCGSKKPRVITTKAAAIKSQKRQEPTKELAVVRSKNGVKRRNSESRTEEKPIDDQPSTIIDKAIDKAISFEGTPYRYGGSTIKGMDCSGLINISFQEAGHKVPRTSSNLFQASRKVSIDRVAKGDLMFFATGRNKKKVNHVALVVEVTPAEIRFVHATTSRGVMVSSFNEPYWLNSYLSSGRLF